MNQIDLKNKSAVVTGGAQGIGLAIAERFLVSGASVCLWDHDEKMVNKTAVSLSSKGRVETAVMDVTDLESVKKAVRNTIDAFGSRYKINLLGGNYSKVAEGLGAYTERVDEPSDLAAAIKRAVTANREGQAALLEVITKVEKKIAQ